jgi:co-chaperonin GroES (HSP10)
MKQIIPLGDNILLEEMEVEQKAGKIIIAGLADENSPRVGKVLDMGPGQMDLSGVHYLDPTEKVVKGDICLVSKHGDYRYSLNGKKYLIVRMANIIGRLEEEDGAGRGIDRVIGPAIDAGEAGGGESAGH